jgi:hypothetical protein
MFRCIVRLVLLLPVLVLALLAGCSAAGAQSAAARGFDTLFQLPDGTTEFLGGQSSPAADDDAVPLTVAACTSVPSDPACVSKAKAVCCDQSVACINDATCLCLMQCRLGGSPGSCGATCGAVDATYTAEAACIAANAPECPGSQVSVQGVSS